jgi:hypothetical protein
MPTRIGNLSKQFDGMPEPMPKKPKPKPSPTPTRKKLPDTTKKIKGGVNPMGYTPSIGASGMSFDHKMS